MTYREETMRFFISATALLLVILNGCAKPKPQPPAYQFQPPARQLNYVNDVEPVLNKRCVVCHSCYNSPCQLKLSSWDGVDRGASKEQIYNAGRLKTMDPSRLLVDAHSTEEWRGKGFFGVSSVEGEDYTDSLLFMMLDHKRISPEVSGEYFSESSDLTCAENKNELTTFLKKHPNRGMPFGFPPLKQEEFNTVAGWLMQGAHGPSPEQQAAMVSIPAADSRMVDKWEAFLNNPDPKHRVTSRYLYEHLFLAHITFETGSSEFYELVRSKAGPGEEIDIIATVRPYDDPGTENFSYRFRKIYSTIVYKTHMVFPMGDEQYQRTQELFIKPEWSRGPRLVGYNAPTNANPFITFEQIPAQSRYQWLLDNAHYIIMTFIRGPVCKGQVALNVIEDHFWVMFVDPDHDLSVQYPGFLKLHYEDLRMPGEKGSDYGIVASLLEDDHYQRAINFYQARQEFYSALYPDGLGLQTIWKGDLPDDDPVLTVFRHFDSASVHRGVLGDLPKTAWVVDYPLLERIYYALVAGFDIYGTAGHQLSTRIYMDALRIEGESYFLDYLPQKSRQEMMASWYIGIDWDDLHYQPAAIPAGVNFMTGEPKRELLEKVVEEHISVSGISFDQNYLRAGQNYPELPEEYAVEAEYLQAFMAVSAPGVSFFRHVADHNANVAWVRITDIPGRADEVVSIVIDRWHNNVRHLFFESDVLDSSKDKADFIKGFVGSYPNYFYVVSSADLPAFFDILDAYDGTSNYQDRLEKYGINRAEDAFWDHYDWFQAAFDKQEQENAGIVDLNRYFHLALGQ